MTGTINASNPQTAQNELITGSVVVAAIVIFIWTGGSAMTAVVRYLTGVGPSVEQVLLTTLLLNIALILFGWRRYRDLQAEVRLRTKAEERARLLAETDPLTGFLNRRSFAEKAATLLRDAQLAGRSVAVLVLDLDNFKQVNDAHGHAAGDQVLIATARRISALMPSSALTARLGGDEFACALLIDQNAPEAVDRIAGDLVMAMSDTVLFNDQHLRISTSIGVAQSSPTTESVDMLIRSADVAMYSAKKKGRNCYARFDGSIEREIAMRNLVAAGIRQGIPNGEFVPFYEPRFALSDRRLIGFEMLMRWRHPTQGLILPELFIPIAETTGQIGDMSLVVMNQAFQEAQSWNTSITLSVNISANQLKDPWLSQKLQKLLVQTGLPASRLEVEITEAALFEDMTLARAIVGSLKNQGISIALDDFGTGYSSLSNLRALPFDRIKINRDFVSSINRDEDSAAFVRTLTRLGDSLGLPVTAVGVEDGAILERLVELGCAEGQGWYLGKPMPVGETRQALAERGLLIAEPLADIARESNGAAFHTAKPGRLAG